MSKSLGNFFTLRDVLDEYNPEVIRFFMLKTHYRSPLNFTHDSLMDTKNNLTRIYQALKDFNLAENDSRIDWGDAYAIKFKAAMDDDFNTPLAISVLFELLSKVNSEGSLFHANLLVNLANLIGLLSSNPTQFLKAGVSLAPEKIEEFIRERNLARINKDFSRSDLMN
jgi:cysteinyl-tRNA synthetase